MIKKICYVRTNVLNGIDSFSNNLITALENQGVEVKEDWPAPGKPIKTNVNSSFDLIFAEDIHAVADHLGEIRKTPIVATLHHINDLTKLRKSAEMVKALICVSHFTESILKERNAIKLLRVSTIHNGIDTNVFTPNVNRVFNRDKVVLFSPQFGSKSKGTSMVLDLAKRLDPERFRIEITSNTKQIFNQNIVHHPMLPRDEFIDLFRSCDVLLFPTLFEGFGLVAAEALALGIPVVTSIGTSVEEIINEETGVLEVQQDLDRVYNAIINLVDNEDKFNEMKVKCRERALDLFSLNLMALKYLEVFERVQRPRPF